MRTVVSLDREFPPIRRTPDSADCMRTGPLAGYGTVGIALIGIALVGTAPVGIGTCTRWYRRVDNERCSHIPAGCSCFAPKVHEPPDQ